jgi:hypothetical protein
MSSFLSTRSTPALAATLALFVSLSCLGQAPAAGPPYQADPSANLPQASQPVEAILDWTPPAMADLTAQASSKTSFTFDRSMLEALAGIEGGNGPELRQAVAKLDAVSVHLLRFGPAGIPSEQMVGAVREAYHARGLKHLVTSVGSGGPIHSSTTDVWLVLDGASIKGAVILGETARSVTLVTVKGGIDPADLLHLRGHFGIPRFDGDATAGRQNN